MQIAINRLSIRRICPTCNSISSASESTPFPVCSKCQTPMIQRIDDTPEAIAKRIDQYFKETEPVLTYFRQHNWLVTIDANQKEQKVFEDITNVLKNI
jgi:adenylate kinase